MVMMQSSSADTSRAQLSPNSSPTSPRSNTSPANDSNTKFRLERPNFTKFDTILMSRFQESNEDIVDSNKPLLFSSKDNHDLDSVNGKFTIERLKQLTDHSISRLSPAEENRPTSPFHIESKFTNNNTNSNNNNNLLSPQHRKVNDEEIVSRNLTIHHPFPIKQHIHQQLHQHHHQQHHQQTLAGLSDNESHLQQPNQQRLSPPSTMQHSPGGPNTNDLDIERIKLATAAAAAARTMANGRPELSDYGFRIQLGGLPATNYARSDTSEELIVDGNDDEEDSNSQEAPSVSTKCGSLAN